MSDTPDLEARLRALHLHYVDRADMGTILEEAADALRKRDAEAVQLRAALEPFAVVASFTEGLADNVMAPAKPLPLDPLSLRNLRRGVSLATDKYKVGGRPKEGPYAVKPITLRLEKRDGRLASRPSCAPAPRRRFFSMWARASLAAPGYRVPVFTVPTIARSTT